MKRILTIFILLFSLTGCLFSLSTKDHISNMMKDELHTFIMDQYNPLKFNNDAATAILLLQSTIAIDLEMVLEKKDLSLEEVTTYYEELTITDVGTAFNMVLAYNILSLDTDNLESYFKSITKSELSSYDYLTVINALSMLGVNSSLKSSLLKEYDDISKLSYIDADLASMVIIAYQGNAPKEYLDYLYTQITSKGVKGWDDIENSCSTAYAIIALMSEGVIYNNNKLVDTLLTYKIEGGFKNKLDDTTYDLSFSTPQAFCALASSYLFEQSSNKVILY